MRCKVTFGLTLLMAVSIGSRVASAHHSYSAFDTQRLVTLEGTIEEFSFVNPHVLVVIKTKDSQTYRAEFPSIAVLSRGDFTRTSLKPGDVVVMSGRPKKDPTDHVVSLMTEIHRPSDGWHWSPTLTSFGLR